MHCPFCNAEDRVIDSRLAMKVVKFVVVVNVLVVVNDSQPFESYEVVMPRVIKSDGKK